MAVLVLLGDLGQPAAGTGVHVLDDPWVVEQIGEASGVRKSVLVRVLVRDHLKRADRGGRCRAAAEYPDFVEHPTFLDDDVMYLGCDPLAGRDQVDWAGDVNQVTRIEAVLARHDRWFVRIHDDTPAVVMDGRKTPCNSR